MTIDTPAANDDTMSNGISPPQPSTLTADEHTPHQPIHTPQKPAVQSTPTYDGTLLDTCADIHSRVQRFLAAPALDSTTQSTQSQVRTGIAVISEALQKYDFTELSMSYNGGKDCQVLLILYLCVLHTYFTQPSGRRKPDSTGGEEAKIPTSIPSIYAKPPDPFDAVTEFVESSTREYCLDLTHISTTPKTHTNNTPQHTSHPPPPHISTDTAQPTTNGVPTKPVTFRDAFASYLQSHPTVKAIFVGTRRTDPHGAKLAHFQLTDGNWPRFVRVHPVIDWRLGEIWCFLRSEHLADSRTGRRLEYCAMYDEGYTSLGGVGDTLRNPRLKYVDEDGVEKYRPAYEMTEDEDERAGRE